MRHVLLTCSFAFAVLAATGCGGSGSSAVTGTVTFDGNPLPDGDILFVDPDGKVAPDAGKIKDGAFAFAVKPGKKKVEIRATKMVATPGGKKGPMGDAEMPTDYIPEKYNAKSELTADIAASGTNSFEFKLLAK